MENILLRSDQKEIAILTLNSPKNLNALSEAMLDALKTNLEEIQQSKKSPDLQGFLMMTFKVRNVFLESVQPRPYR